MEREVQRIHDWERSETGRQPKSSTVQYRHGQNSREHGGENREPIDSSGRHQVAYGEGGNSAICRRHCLPSGKQGEAPENIGYMGEI